MKLFVIMVALVLLSPHSPSQIPGPILTYADFVYSRGYVLYPNFPISLFVPKYLQSACESLKNDDIESAKNLFSKEMKKNPDDFGAIIGFLQTQQDQWEKLLPQYEQEATLNPTASNEFKVGVLAYYILEKNLYRYEGMVMKRDPKNPHHFYSFGTIPSKQLIAERKQITDIARHGLKQFWEHTQNPILILLISPYPVFNHYNGMFEGIIKSVGGTREYQAYINAKNKDWVAHQPPMGEYSRLDLTLLHFVADGYFSFYSYRKQYTALRKINGKLTRVNITVPLTSTQKHAKAYFGYWLRRIDTKLAETKPKAQRE